MLTLQNTFLYFLLCVDLKMYMLSRCCFIFKCEIHQGLCWYGTCCWGLFLKLRFSIFLFFVSHSLSSLPTSLLSSTVSSSAFKTGDSGLGGSTTAKHNISVPWDKVWNKFWPLSILCQHKKNRVNLFQQKSYVNLMST